MPKKPQPEKHSRPSPPRLEAQAFVSVLRAADALSREAEALLKPSGLSGTQYNVLRILRGAGPEGLACRDVGCRLISRDPDITRLLDRMEARELIRRAREEKDRRVVKTRITEEGLRILAAMDRPVEDLHRRQLRRIPSKDLRQLLQLLEKIGSPTEAPDCEHSVSKSL